MKSRKAVDRAIKLTMKEKRLSFYNLADFNRGNSSSIWIDIRKDFQAHNSHLRGYGLSTHKQWIVNLYIKLFKILDLPFRSIRFVLNRVRNILMKALSFIVFKNSMAGKKFGFDTYSADSYNKYHISNFLTAYSKFNIGFSHNTFKSYSILQKLKQHVKIPSDLKIFEIGAGLFNFGHLLQYNLDKFEYIICDLPEMIIAAHLEITEKYLPLCNSNYDVYLPNELPEFYSSKSDRKVLFITPEQLEKDVLGNDKKFDLFINHESFSEMDIGVVNKYLSKVKILMKKGSIVNLVNRHSRMQSSSQEGSEYTLDNITSFDSYELDFLDVILKETDTFRSKIKSIQGEPNVFFIGQVK
jgi:putative sugar O-methyltransferase